MKNLNLAEKIYYNRVVFAMTLEEDFDYSTEHLYELNLVANVRAFRKFIKARELDDDALFDYSEDFSLYHKMYADLEEHGFNLV